MIEEFENDIELLQIVDSIQDILDDYNILSSESDMSKKDSFYSFGPVEVCLSISKITGNTAGCPRVDEIFSKIQNMLPIMENRIGVKLRCYKSIARNYTHIYVGKYPF
jgi:hypothetical protein